MTATDDLLASNQRYAASYDKGALTAAPAKGVVVLTCMDARLDPARFLGLEEGDAHVIRNAGGVATDDAIRSVVISQRLVGTESIVIVHHTGCGMESFTDAAMKDELVAETGIRPSFSFEAFPDAAADVRQTAARLAASPFVRHEHVRGFVYDVESGRLHEVALDGG